MQSARTERFVEMLAALPDRVQRQARRAYHLWRQDPTHRSLAFKRLEGTEEIVYSVRIGRRWRALGTIDGDRIIWFWIGSHAEYDRVIENL